ncbi:MAG: four helix bundle protein [Ignavibacteriaceae bacterium]|nr:four helix bundle protein [Ignavibacteriaceae bacterium]
MSDYQDLKVWQAAKNLAVELYKITMKFDKKDFDIVSQMRRSAISIPSNIAEGMGRSHPKETLHYLHIARGSLFELDTQILIVEELNLCSIEEIEKLNFALLDVKKLLNAFIKYYKNKNNI